MKILNIAVSLALLGIGGASMAAEPTRLSDAALDFVTAGIASGFSYGATTGAFAFGRSVKIQEKSTSETVSKTVYNGGNAVTTFRTSSTAQGSTQSSAPGPTGSGNSGFVYANAFYD